MKNDHLNLESTSSIYIFLVILAIIVYILFNLILVVTKILQYNTNPFSKEPWVFSSITKEFSIFIIKNFLAILQALNNKNDFGIYELLILFALYSIIIYLIYRSPMNPQEYITYCEIFLVTTIYIMIIFSLISYIFAEHAESLLTFVVVVLIVNLFIIVKRKNDFSKVIFEAFKIKASASFTHHVDIIVGFAKLFEQFDNPESKMKLLALHKVHIKTCNALSCACNQFRSNLEPGEQKNQDIAQNNIKDEVIVKNKFESVEINFTKENLKNISFKILLSELLKVWEINRRVEFLILYNQVQFYLMNLKYKCLFEINSFKTNKPSLFEKYEIYSLQQNICQSIKENERILVSSKKSNNSAELTNYIFNHKLNDSLSRNMKKCSFHYQSVWELFSNNQNQYFKLINGVKILALDFEKIEKIFQKIQFYNNSSIKASCLMALFNYYIVDDPFSAQEMSLNVKKFQDNYKINFHKSNNLENKLGENSKVSIIQISAQKDILGKIISSNSEITTILDYQPSEIINKNLSILLPEQVKTKHNLILLDWMSNEKNQLENNVDINVIVQHLRGFFVPCNIISKLIIDKLNKLRFITFISENVFSSQYRNSDESICLKETILFLLDKDGWIVNLNDFAISFIFKEEIKKININNYIKSEEKVKIYDLFPEFANEDAKELLNSQSGYTEKFEMNSFVDKMKSVFRNYEIYDDIKNFEQNYNNNNETIHKNAYLSYNAQFRSLLKDDNLIICSILILNNDLKNKYAMKNSDDVEIVKDEDKNFVNQIVDDAYQSASVSSTSSSDSRLGGKVVREYKKITSSKRSSISIKLSRIFSILIFLIIFIFFTIDFVLVVQNVENYKNNINNNQLIYELTEEIAQSEVSLQTVYNIIYELEDNTSLIKGFSNKIMANLELIQEFAESIRKVSHLLNTLSNFETISSFMNHFVYVPSLKNDLKTYYFTNVTIYGLTSLIVNSLHDTKIIREALEHSHSGIKIEISTELKADFLRNYFFVMNNTLNFYYLLSYDRTHATGLELVTKCSSTIILISSISAAFCGIFLVILLLYVVYIFRIYTNCFKVCELFLIYDKSKRNLLQKKIDTFSNLVDTNLVSIKKFFQETNFNLEEITYSEFESKKKEEAKLSLKIEKDKTENKNNIHNLKEIFWSFKRNFGINIIILAIIVIAFPISKIFYFKYQSEKILQGIKASNSLLQLSPSFSEIELFTKYTISQGYFPIVEHNNTQFNLLEFIIDSAEDNNEALRVALTQIYGFYENFDVVYKEMIFDNFCDTFKMFLEDKEECQEEGGSLFISGISNLKSTFLNLYINLFNELSYLIDVKKASLVEIHGELQKYPKINEYSELKVKYMEEFFDLVCVMLDDDLKISIDNIEQNYKILYPVSSIIAFAIFLFYLQYLLSRINEKVIYIRRFLGLIPSEFIRFHQAICNSLLKSIS